MKSFILDIKLSTGKNTFNSNEDIMINVKFTIDGLLPHIFNEKNWTYAYNENDTQIKIKYGIKLIKNGIKKHDVGTAINTYKKATFFWTRNPKLVNPSEKKRIWVQIIKNFRSYIYLDTKNILKNLCGFNENILIRSSELGIGSHKIISEVYVSWKKHTYIEEENIKKRSQEIEIIINQDIK